MRLEYLPIGSGIIVALLGIGIIWDAKGPQTRGPIRDRRRRFRAPIDTFGELLAGLGILILGGALVGSDWRYETVTVLSGTALVLVGAVRNRRYFREVFLFRGAARRGPATEPHVRPKGNIKTRIR